ncbi:MAG: hypothetical protein DRR06_14380 [Gammaproteobacteria bacterium]|nr:MAG: hypothetical protein DRR06_14380 [Gammaproteobacteria bacterium]RLA46052.1 MAG: hypothetical protein DRR42_18760 [Gammaproteobacteria bacterium]
MKEFVPASDEVLDILPDLFNRLVPYQSDYACRRLYRQPVELTPADLQVQIPAHRPTPWDKD